MMGRTILVVVDPNSNEDQPAIERAAWLAERVSADLELFGCDYDSEIDDRRVGTVWIPHPGAHEKLMLGHRQKLDALAAPLRKHGLKVTVDVAWDHPFGEAILRKVQARKPWMVAKDTEYHSVLRRTVLSNTDWYLIRSCPAPLLLVKARPIASKPKVFAAVDPLHQHDKPAQLDDSIFRFADALARDTGGTLHVVHAYSAPMGLELPPDAAAAIAREHRDAMGSFLTSHVVPTRDTYLLEGPTHECLQQVAAEQGADFMVMGAVSRRGLNRLFIGSTAERVLDRLSCDLVILKPAGFKPPALD